MARKRTRKRQHLPKYVYEKRGWYIYRPYLGSVNGKPQFGSDIRLCPLSAPLSQLHQAYEGVTQADDTGTLKWLLRAYHDSKRFKELTPRTQKDYGQYRDIIIAYPTRNGRLLGDFKLELLTKRTAVGLRDRYTGKDGKHKPVMANRLLQYLKAAHNAMEEEFTTLPANPWTVRLNTEKARDRYVSQAEFAAFKETTTGYLPLFMELGYLCRARLGEIARLKNDDLLAEGLRLARSKGSEGEVTAYSPRLAAAVKSCKAFNAEAPTPITGAYLIHDKHGSPIKRNAFQTAWGRAMRAWVAKGNERFTFHDLKAAGITDQKDNFGGHKDTSGKMRKVYVRQLPVVEPPA